MILLLCVCVTCAVWSLCVCAFHCVLFHTCSVAVLGLWCPLCMFCLVIYSSLLLSLYFGMSCPLFICLFCRWFNIVLDCMICHVPTLFVCFVCCVYVCCVVICSCLPFVCVARRLSFSFECTTFCLFVMYLRSSCCLSDSLSLSRPLPLSWCRCVTLT